MARGTEGNLCLFLLVRVTCVLMFVVGLGVLADGIYAIIQSPRFDYYTGGVIIFGVVILLMSTLGYLNRSSPFLLVIYLTVLFLSFLALTSMAIVMIIDPSFVKKVGGETNANYLRYSLLCAAVIALIAVLLACCYRSSLLIAVFKGRRKGEVKVKELGKNDGEEALIVKQEKPLSWRERRKLKADKAMENFVSTSPANHPNTADTTKEGDKGKGSGEEKKPMIIPVLPSQKPRSANLFPS